MLGAWEENVRKVTPYIPGEQPGGDVIKLNTNENPYPPCEGVKNILRDYDCSNLRKYPDPNMMALRETIAKYHGVSKDNVFVGVGSDDVLATAFLTFFNSKLPILFADITYSFYDVWAELFGIPYKKIPLKEDFSINTSEYLEKNGGIVIANPNAPTGISLSVDSISQLAYLNPDSVIIVDEAYVDFSEESALALHAKYDHLLVVRTFSKSRSLAGSRIGYAIGSKKLIDHLFAVRNSFNSYTIDSVTQAIGVASINDEKYFKKNIELIVATREWFKEEMQKLGFDFFDSKTNFLFAKHETVSAIHIFEELKKRNIYVRHFNQSRIKNYLRISIGTPEEMSILLNTLKEIL